jgi:hypothetical protein
VEEWLSRSLKVREIMTITNDPLPSKVPAIWPKCRRSTGTTVEPMKNHLLLAPSLETEVALFVTFGLLRFLSLTVSRSEICISSRIRLRQMLHIA